MVSMIPKSPVSVDAMTLCTRPSFQSVVARQCAQSRRAIGRHASAAKPQDVGEANARRVAHVAAAPPGGTGRYHAAMMLEEISNELNLPLDRVADDLKKMVAEMGPRARWLVVRCGALPKGAVFGNLLCRIDIASEPLAAAGPSELVYPYVVFLCDIWPIDRMPTLLRGLAVGGLEVGGRRVEMGGPQRLWTRFDLPGRNDFSLVPGSVFREQAGYSFAESELARPLLAHGAPFHPDAYSGLGRWTSLDRISARERSFVGEVLIFAPWAKAHFANVSLDGDRVVFRTSGDRETRDRLIVRGGSWSDHASCRSFECPVVEGVAAVPSPGNGLRFEAYLLGPGHEVLDCYKEYRGAPGTHGSVVFPRAHGAGMLAEVERDALGGEHERVELKPYLDLANPKAMELVKTAVAMANGDGGRILVGVRDDCTIEGIEREVCSSRRGGDVVAAAERYRGEVIQYIAAKVRPGIDVVPTLVEVQEHTVLVLDVQPGEQTPYCAAESKVVYVRRGSSNGVVDPVTELRALLDRGADPFLRRRFSRTPFAT